ncbi:TPR end-of-group domain-containing protein [Pedobacter cryoconitis]|uniref:Transglutaminase superfamily protein n=1 Tax=Pedobacter cryoconitis TaxID=188932 RepID=A0A327SBD7_9SPHI|nr:transglutaminase domain-containing protein [Pedobacter cryoconitis]RAJ26346.1 transglutaminase superfamily protein [Pedobacter cryoconitis]
MRKFIAAFLVVTCVTLSAFSQSSVPDEAFEQSYQVSIQSVIAAYNRKDYVASNAELVRFLQKFKVLSADIKQKYKGALVNQYYSLSCVNALSGNKNKAILYLDSAVQNGFGNYKNMMADTDLDGLRGDTQFKTVVEKIRARGDYSYILQKSGMYDQKDKRVALKFTYQDSNAPELVKFRKNYKLDSVSGNGDETSRFKNLLFWVHNSVKHDGSIDNPKNKNAVDLLEICKKEDRGLNCRMMATILKDAYQAMGYKSRMVTCMPKDTTDLDCHVITIVWSEKMDKWVWMDPTFNAYVSDAQGTLLNVEEVRTKLIAGEPLVLNEDANWNNKKKYTREYYLDYYMSKNLYWISCDVKNEWDAETRSAGKPLIEDIHLYPGGFSKIKGDKLSDQTGITYATSNAAYFWAKPGK